VVRFLRQGAISLSSVNVGPRQDPWHDSQFAIVKGLGIRFDWSSSFGAEQITLTLRQMQKRAILLIVAGLFAWGIYHAVGAYLYNHNPWRAVVVMTCVCGFLGFWLLLLATRRPR
jgi:hypothetical protein